MRCIQIHTATYPTPEHAHVCVCARTRVRCVCMRACMRVYMNLTHHFFSQTPLLVFALGALLSPLCYPLLGLFYPGLAQREDPRPPNRRRENGGLRNQNKQTKNKEPVLHIAGKAAALAAEIVAESEDCVERHLRGEHQVEVSSKLKSAPC